MSFPYMADAPGGGQPVVLMGDMDGGQTQDLGQPSVTLAMLIIILLGLKVFSDSRMVAFEPKEAKVSLFNILNIGMQSVVFILLLKLGSAALLRRGIVIPGLPDLVGAI